MITCKRCGHNVFKKTSVLSCNAVPPIFNCIKCGMTQNIPRTYWKESKDFLPFNTKEDYFISFLKCARCEKEDLTPIEDVYSLPDGWTMNEVEITDPNGDMMVRRYVYCPDCSKS